jgi:hypothetical protein
VLEAPMLGGVWWRILSPFYVNYRCPENFKRHKIELDFLAIALTRAKSFLDKIT